MAMVETRHRDAGLCMGRVGPLCVALWRTKPTRLLFAVQRDELANVVTQHPGAAVLLCIIQASAEPPDPDVRKASMEMVTAHGDRLVATCCVIEGSGFRAAVTRSVLAGIAFMAKTRINVQFVADLNAAATWLGGQAPAAGVTDLARTVDHWRAGLQA